MQILGILLLALVGQDANADGYFKFSKGTTWTYDQQEDGEKGTVTLTVRGEENRKVVVDSKESKGEEDEEAKEEMLLWYVENGLLRWAQKGEGEAEPMFTIWKVGAKKGDTWIGMGGANASFSLTAKHMGETTVETPYKNFDKAIHVQLGMEKAMEGFNMTINIYLVDGIGVVKFAGEMGGERGFSLKLREFKVASGAVDR